MRQRRVKDLEERLVQLNDLLVKNPRENKGRWKDVLSCCGQLFVELGCGKGQFLTAHAAAAKNDWFIGIEGQKSVLLRAGDSLRQGEIENACLMGEYVKDIGDYFEDGELSGLYLNFSDPWPKARHAKRRLTHRRYLEGYRHVLIPGGFVEFKSDNDDLYAFTLEEIQACRMEIVEATDDLHNSQFESRKYRTEYEERFMNRGKNINYIKFLV